MPIGFKMKSNMVSVAKLLKVKINENFTNFIKKDELSKDNGSNWAKY